MKNKGYKDMVKLVSFNVENNNNKSYVFKNESKRKVEFIFNGIIWSFKADDNIDVLSILEAWEMIKKGVTIQLW